MMILGNDLLQDHDDFICVDKIRLLVNNNNGAEFLFIHTMVLLIYSFVMWLIFFYIPKKYGLVVFESHR